MNVLSTHRIRFGGLHEEQGFLRDALRILNDGQCDGRVALIKQLDTQGALVEAEAKKGTHRQEYFKLGSMKRAYEKALLLDFRLNPRPVDPLLDAIAQAKTYFAPDELHQALLLRKYYPNAPVQ